MLRCAPHVCCAKAKALDFSPRYSGSTSVEGHPGLHLERTHADALHSHSFPPPIRARSLPLGHAYRLAVDFRRIVVRWFPLRRTELSDQLDRASISVPLNVAEGAGRSTTRERARHYTIARGSAVECLARLDLLELEVAAPDTTEARAIVLRLLNVLTAVIRRPI